MAERVFVGMSGGVDSSLTAALLCEQGYDVTGVYLRNWSRDLPGYKCPWAEDLADAERVAAKLGIELLVWDCEQEYRAGVVDYLVQSYAHGLTPNPDVMCNEKIKFGVFVDKALAAGADWVATGHYARVEQPADTAGNTPAPAKLLRACDEHKDQTYFLWRVSGSTLRHVIFPIGDISDKARVREMAAERGLSVAQKPDSQGICFVGEVGMKPFLLDYIDRQPGDIVEWETGRVLGRHEGTFLYTIGQRKGLGVGGGPKHYVVETDTANHIVYVSADPQCPALWTHQTALESICWVGGEPCPGACLVRTRHTGQLVKAQVTCSEGSDTAMVTFDQIHQRVAPGQSVVMYRGTECIGGGIASASSVLADRPKHA